tara:strand:+ start:7098 stop:9572 length:2475 start_codon:yes stop_codon:yes gene_type:complete
MEYTDNELDRIISLTGKQRGLKIKDILDRAVDKLKVEAQKAPDSGEAFKRIPSQRKELRVQLMEAIENRGKTSGKSTGALKQLNKIINMNIFHNGNLVSAANLTNSKLTGKIEIRKPNPSIFDKGEFDIKMKGGTSLSQNLLKIKAILDESKVVVEDKPLDSRFPLNKFLGAVDTSKGKYRLGVYSYWEEIARLFAQLKTDAEELLDAITSSQLDDETKDKFVKLFDMESEYGLDRLQYIAKFPTAEGEVLEARHRFFNIVTAMIATEGLLDTSKIKGKGFSDVEEDEVSYGDLNAEQAAEMLQGIKDSDFGSAEKPETVFDASLDMNMTDDGVDWLGDVSVLKAAADPLLMYEHARGNKLLSMTEQGEEDLVYLLDNAINEIEERDEKGENPKFNVTLDFKTNLSDWIDQLEDTTTLDDGVDFWLPISVMDNTDFDDLYEETNFDGFDGHEFVSIDSLDDIGNFFDGLYDLMAETSVTFASDVRSTKGRRRGTDIRETFRGKMKTRLGRAVSRQSRKTDSVEGKLDENLLSEDIKGALEKFMETSLEYYFTPAYSGNLPVQIPSFMGSIGGKVMQTLALDLGLETVMSGSYKKLMQGSAKSIRENDLKKIADFLDRMFLKSIRIDAFLVTQAENAAKALTRIFGKKEDNNNYFAGLLYHFMEQTKDFQRETNDFNGKPIKERATAFDEGYNNRKAYPIFAMPHWLDMNQGLITQKSPKAKTQYNRLKVIFEEVQQDLPVLLHKMLMAHDAIRKELGLETSYGFFPLNHNGYDAMINKMYVDANIDLSNYEVETIVKAIDSHENISKEYGISTEQVYMIKSHFR